jgi:uncharacterized protein DUF5666
MNTRIFSLTAIAAAALFAATLAPCAASASGSGFAAAAGSRHDQGRVFNVSGRIEAVDYTANVIVVRGKGQVMSIALTPTTSVELAGQTGSIADLRPGAHVRVRGSVRDGTMVADSIVVK